MAKRYGRNQKRKHREKIAELENKNQRLNRSVNFLNNKNNQNKQHLEDIINELNEWWNNSVLVAPKIKKYRGTLPRIYNLRPRHTINTLTPLEMEYLKTDLLEAVYISVQENIETQSKHIILRTPMGDNGYYIDRNVLRNFKRMPSKVFKQIKERIAYELIHHLTKEKLKAG